MSCILLRLIKKADAKCTVDSKKITKFNFVTSQGISLKIVSS